MWSPAFNATDVANGCELININGVTYQTVEVLKSESSAEIPPIEPIAEPETINTVENDGVSMLVSPDPNVCHQVTFYSDYKTEPLKIFIGYDTFHVHANLLKLHLYKGVHQFRPSGIELWALEPRYFEIFLDYIYGTYLPSYTNLEYAKTYQISEMFVEAEVGRTILQDWQRAITDGDPRVASDLGDFLRSAKILYHGADWDADPADEIRDFFRISAPHLLKSDAVTTGANYVGCKNKAGIRLALDSGGRLAEDLMDVLVGNLAGVSKTGATIDLHSHADQGLDDEGWPVPQRVANNAWGFAKKPVDDPWGTDNGVADENGVNDWKKETAAPSEFQTGIKESFYPPPSQIQTPEQPFPKNTTTATALQNSDERCSIEFSAGDIFTDVVSISDSPDH